MAWKLNDKEGTLENFSIGSGTLYDNFHFAMTKSSEYDIIVKTRDTAGAVITGCSIYVDGVATGTTDNYGYQFINKGTDSYIVKATKTGYYDTSKTIAHTDGDITNVFLDMEYKYSNLDKITFYPDDNKYVKQYDDYTGDRVFATVNRTDLSDSTFTSTEDGEVTGHSERSLFDAFLILTTGTPETTRVVMVKDDVDDYVRFFSSTGETKAKVLRSGIASGNVPDVSPALSRKDCFDYMAEIATGTHPPDLIVTSGLKAHWSFDVATVTKDGGSLVSAVTDASGNGRSISQSTGSNQPIWRTTHSGSLEFNRTGDYLESSDDIDTIVGTDNVEDITIQFWIKKRGEGPTLYNPSWNYKTPIGTSVGSNFGGLNFYTHGANNAKLYADFNYHPSSRNWNVGVFHDMDDWYLYTYTYDGSNIKVYKNTTLGQNASQTGKLKNTDTPIRIGKGAHGSWGGSIYVEPANNWMENGWLGNIRIYNRALTLEEITKNFDAEKGRFGV